ncbi:MAG: hypothetical protein LBE55_03320 [Clostridiales bacterium]|jgi:hypothetical protein|nr:hypothetical protein [Clostridiales bacterium]
MAYASLKHYKKVHKGICEDNTKGRLAAASALIDALTHNRIQAAGFEGLTDFQKAAVKKACCLIVDHMAQSGAAMGADIDTFSLQDIRVRMRRRKLRPWEAAGCGLWAWLTLLQTGLMRGNLP